MKILLIQYKMLGDVLTSTVIADQLKKAFPSASIDYLIIANAAAIVQEHPSIDGIIPVKKADMSTLGGIISLSRKLKQNNYSLLIDAYCKNNSALLSWLSGIPQRIGYNKWFAGLAYTTGIKNNPDKKLFATGLSIGSRLILTTPLIKNVDWHLKPSIHLTETEKQGARKWLIQHGLDINKKITMVSVLGSAVNKTLPLKKMAAFIDQYMEGSDSQILFNYIPSQKESALNIYQACRKKHQQRIFIDAFAPSIRSFLAVLSQCHATIGNEGGAINMAKALNVPTFAIFSPWISKEVWNLSVDGHKHIAVHLKDQRPELFTEGTNKDYRKISLDLYENYKIEEMKSTIEHFIKYNRLND